MMSQMNSPTPTSSVPIVSRHVALSVATGVSNADFTHARPASMRQCNVQNVYRKTLTFIRKLGAPWQREMRKKNVKKTNTFTWRLNRFVYSCEVEPSISINQVMDFKKYRILLFFCAALLFLEMFFFVKDYRNASSQLLPVKDYLM